MLQLVTFRSSDEEFADGYRSSLCTGTVGRGSRGDLTENKQQPFDGFEITCKWKVGRRTSYHSMRGEKPRFNGGD